MAAKTSRRLDVIAAFFATVAHRRRQRAWLAVLLTTVAVVAGMTIAVPAGASAETDGAKTAIGDYFLADAAKDWEAAARVSSGLANARVRYFALLDETEGLPDPWVLGRTEGAQVSVTVNAVSRSGAVTGSATVTGTDSRGPVNRTYKGLAVTKRGKTWRLDNWNSQTTGAPLDAYFIDTPAQKTVGGITLRFEVGRSYVDANTNRTVDAAYALRVRNGNSQDVATFQKITVRSKRGATWSIADADGTAGDELEFSGDHTEATPQLAVGIQDTMDPRSETGLFMAAPPGAFTGGTIEVTYLVGGKPVTVGLALPAVPMPPGYPPLGAW